MQQYQQQVKTVMYRRSQEQAIQYGQSTSIVNFIPLDKIGEGSFSSVYKVRRITDDCVYALKKIKIASLKQKEKQNALNQIRILASIDSPYIVQYKQAFFDHKLNLLCIVMEYASNLFVYADDGDLQKKVQLYRKSMTHIPENQIWKAAYQTLKGLDILHSKSILHRDIKSANIFIANGVYKLGDLNVSKVQDTMEKLAYTQTGTPYYASPEVWRDEPYDNKSDIWSLGCVLYEMCTYRPPFKGKDLESLYRSVQRGLYDTLPIQYSQQLSQLISCCLRLNSKHRMTCKQLLSTNWMQKKIHELKLNDGRDEYDPQLLKTIKLPNDLKDLRKKLPKSKYSCSTDNINYKNNQQVNQFIECQQYQNSIKKHSNHDYYLQMAKKKKQGGINSINLQPLKLNRVISEGSVNGNPQTTQPNTKILKVNQSPNKVIQSNRELYEIQSENRKKNEFNVRSSTPCSETCLQQKPSKLQQQQKQKPLPYPQLKADNSINHDKYLINLKKTEQNKTRKLSHDQQCQRSKRQMLNHLSLIKKLSQQHPNNNSLSQRYISSDLMLDKYNQNGVDSERNADEESIKRMLVSKKSEELLSIQRRVEEKRRELRKIGSIQRLQAGSKNNQNLSYRPPLVIRPHLKKSTAHMSNILLKSPVSTQDQQLSNRMKQKMNSQKKLSINSHGGISPTPYMMKIGQVPRVKGLLQNLNEAKKVRQAELKNKILINRYLNKY